jgi:hypothetical protein
VESKQPTLGLDISESANHKVLTYIEYRAVSGVFQTIDPPPPLRPASVSFPRTNGRGYTLAGQWGGWGVKILEDARHWLASYSIITLRYKCTMYYLYIVHGTKQVLHLSSATSITKRLKLIKDMIKRSFY